MTKRFSLKLGDVVLMALVAVMAALLFILPFLQERSTTAEILFAETGEKRIVSLDKDADYEIVSRGVTLTVSAADGKVFVSRSDCRDGICRSTPPISNSGQTIICAPAGVVIRILGEEDVIDGVAG